MPHLKNGRDPVAEAHGQYRATMMWALKWPERKGCFLKPTSSSISSSFRLEKFHGQQSGQKGDRQWSLRLEVSLFSKLTDSLFGGTDGHLSGPAPPLLQPGSAEMRTERETLGRLGGRALAFWVMDFCPPPKEATVNNTK